MKVLDKGHFYELANLDEVDGFQHLTFVKRDDPPEKYPGNKGHYPGVNIQEVFRALIDRTQYLMGQAKQLGDPHSEVEDQRIIRHLRESMTILEVRAHRKHGSILPYLVDDIETYPACPTCGHILCTWC